MISRVWISIVIAGGGSLLQCSTHPISPESSVFPHADRSALDQAQPRMLIAFGFVVMHNNCHWGTSTARKHFQEGPYVQSIRHLSALVLSSCLQLKDRCNLCSFMVSIMVLIFIKWVCSNQGCNGNEGVVRMRVYDTNMSHMALFIILCDKKCGFDNRSIETCHVIRMANLPSQTFTMDQHFG